MVTAFQLFLGCKNHHGSVTPNRMATETLRKPKMAKITVYATKAGYSDSDVATRDINIAGTGIEGDVNGDGVVNAADVVKISNIIMGK